MWHPPSQDPNIDVCIICYEPPVGDDLTLSRRLKTRHVLVSDLPPELGLLFPPKNEHPLTEPKEDGEAFKPSADIESEASNGSGGSETPDPGPQGNNPSDTESSDSIKNEAAVSKPAIKYIVPIATPGTSLSKQAENFFSMPVAPATNFASCAVTYSAVNEMVNLNLSSVGTPEMEPVPSFQALSPLPSTSTTFTFTAPDKVGIPVPELKENKPIVRQLRTFFVLKHIFNHPLDEVSIHKLLMLVQCPSDWFVLCPVCEYRVDQALEVIEYLKGNKAFFRESYENFVKDVVSELRQRFVDSFLENTPPVQWEFTGEAWMKTYNDASVTNFLLNEYEAVMEFRKYVISCAFSRLQEALEPTDNSVEVAALNENAQFYEDEQLFGNGEGLYTPEEYPGEGEPMQMQGEQEEEEEHQVYNQEGIEGPFEMEPEDYYSDDFDFDELIYDPDHQSSDSEENQEVAEENNQDMVADDTE